MTKLSVKGSDILEEAKDIPILELNRFFRQKLRGKVVVDEAALRSELDELTDENRKGDWLTVEKNLAIKSFVEKKVLGEEATSVRKALNEARTRKAIPLKEFKKEAAP